MNEQIDHYMIGDESLSISNTELPKSGFMIYIGDDFVRIRAKKADEVDAASTTIVIEARKVELAR